MLSGWRSRSQPAANLAKQYKSPVCFVGVTSAPPSSVAKTLEEYHEKLKAFGKEQSGRQGVDFETKTVASHDIPAELDDLLLDTTNDIGADLIVMAPHVPGLPEHIFASNAGYVASHAPVSVFVVRRRASPRSEPGGVLFVSPYSAKSRSPLRSL